MVVKPQNVAISWTQLNTTKHMEDETVAPV